MQRNGNVYSIAFKDLDKVDGTNLKPVIRDKVSREATLISDGFGGYFGLDKEYKQHERVFHTRREYVRGEYHTNSIEGFFSHMKRTIKGTYIYISRKHVNMYCKEIDFRYNTRENSTEERINLTLQNCSGRLKYKDLIKD